MKIHTQEDNLCTEVTGESLGGGKHALHVISEGAGVGWDRIDVTYPTTSSEAYAYKLGGVTVRTVTVTYTTSTKDILLSVVRS